MQRHCARRARSAVVTWPLLVAIAMVTPAIWANPARAQQAAMAAELRDAVEAFVAPRQLWGWPSVEWTPTVPGDCEIGSDGASARVLLRVERDDASVDFWIDVRRTDSAWTVTTTQRDARWALGLAAIGGPTAHASRLLGELTQRLRELPRGFPARLATYTLRDQHNRNSLDAAPRQSNPHWFAIEADATHNGVTVTVQIELFLEVADEGELRWVLSDSAAFPIVTAFSACMLDEPVLFADYHAAVAQAELLDDEVEVMLDAPVTLREADDGTWRFAASAVRGNEVVDFELAVTRADGRLDGTATMISYVTAIAGDPQEAVRAIVANPDDPAWRNVMRIIGKRAEFVPWQVSGVRVESIAYGHGAINVGLDVSLDYESAAVTVPMVMQLGPGYRSLLRVEAEQRDPSVARAVERACELSLAHLPSLIRADFIEPFNARDTARLPVLRTSHDREIALETVSKDVTLELVDLGATIGLPWPLVDVRLLLHHPRETTSTHLRCSLGLGGGWRYTIEHHWMLQSAPQLQPYRQPTAGFLAKAQPLLEAVITALTAGERLPEGAVDRAVGDTAVFVGLEIVVAPRYGESFLATVINADGWRTHYVDATIDVVGDDERPVVRGSDIERLGRAIRASQTLATSPADAYASLCDAIDQRDDEQLSAFTRPPGLITAARLCGVRVDRERSVCGDHGAAMMIDFVLTRDGADFEFWIQLDVVDGAWVASDASTVAFQVGRVARDVAGRRAADPTRFGVDPCDAGQSVVGALVAADRDALRELCGVPLADGVLDMMLAMIDGAEFALVDGAWAYSTPTDCCCTVTLTRDGTQVVRPLALRIVDETDPLRPVLRFELVETLAMWNAWDAAGPPESALDAIFTALANGDLEAVGLANGNDGRPHGPWLVEFGLARDPTLTPIADGPLLRGALLYPVRWRDNPFGDARNDPPEPVVLVVEPVGTTWRVDWVRSATAIENARAPADRFEDTEGEEHPRYLWDVMRALRTGDDADIDDADLPYPYALRGLQFNVKLVMDASGKPLHPDRQPRRYALHIARGERAWRIEVERRYQGGDLRVEAAGLGDALLEIAGDPTTVARAYVEAGCAGDVETLRALAQDSSEFAVSPAPFIGMHVNHVQAYADGIRLDERWRLNARASVHTNLSVTLGFMLALEGGRWRVNAPTLLTSVATALERHTRDNRFIWFESVLNEPETLAAAGVENWISLACSRSNQHGLYREYRYAAPRTGPCALELLVAYLAEPAVTLTVIGPAGTVVELAVAGEISPWSRYRRAHEFVLTFSAQEGETYRIIVGSRQHVFPFWLRLAVN